MTSSNGNPPAPVPAPWWRSAPALYTLFVTSVVGASLGWLTGIHNRLDAHSQRIQILEVQGAQQAKQLDRIESKLDRLREGRR